MLASAESESPEGTIENSPAIHRWEPWQSEPSPGGTAEAPSELLPSLRDLCRGIASPSDESLSYS